MSGVGNLGMDGRQAIEVSMTEGSNIRRRLAELELQTEEYRYFVPLAKKLLEISTDAIFQTDAQLKIIQCNAAFCRLFEASISMIVGKGLCELFADWDKGFAEDALAVLTSQGRWEGELRRSAIRGELRIESLVISRVAGKDGLVECHVGIVRDLSELRSARDILDYSTKHDNLTGLANRDFFSTALGELLRRSEQSGGIVAVCLLDLDNFKQVNTDCSREAGDCLLKAVGKRLTEALRLGDLLARSGGDEFSLALPLRSADELAPLAARIITLFDEPFEAADRLIHLHATMGAKEVKIVFATRRAELDEVFHGIPGRGSQEDTGRRW